MLITNKHKKLIDNHDRSSIIISMKKLTTEKRRQVIASLTEGMGINPVCRVTAIAKNTVLKLLAELGEACGRLPR